MAARRNKKRGFLFVSNLLGKHLPVHPTIPLLSSRLLAHQFVEQTTGERPNHTNLLAMALRSKSDLTSTYKLLETKDFNLNRPMTFIGFAETATALGHGFFDCFKNARYVHTTREELLDIDSAINFEEEHSHASSHRCYAHAESMFLNNDPIVLIDDEMTTGNTTINIIKSIQEKFPRKDYYVVSLLDWRSKQDLERFDELMELYDIHIQSISLMKGSIEVQGSPVTEAEDSWDQPISNNDKVNVSFHTIKTPFNPLPYTSINGAEIKNTSGYLPITGRFGLEYNDIQVILDAAKAIGEDIQSMRKGANTLCLGTGEFMHFPMVVATHMGDGVSFHATTRSPIHPVNKDGYAIDRMLSFDGPTDPSIRNFVYNIPDNHYDEIFVFFEREEAPEQLDSFIKALSMIGVKELNIIIFK